MLARKWCIATVTAAAAALGVGGATTAVAAPVSAPVGVDRPAVGRLSSLEPLASSPVQIHDAGLHAAPETPGDLQPAGAVRLSHIKDGLRLDFYDTNAGSATYRVTYRTPTGTNISTHDLGTQTSYVATGLMSGVSYTFALTSVRDGVSTTVLTAKQTR